MSYLVNITPSCKRSIEKACKKNTVLKKNSSQKNARDCF